MFSAVNVHTMQQSQGTHLTNGCSSTSTTASNESSYASSAVASPSYYWRQQMQHTTTTTTTTTFPVDSYSAGLSFVAPSTPVAPIHASDFHHPHHVPVAVAEERRKTPRDSSESTILATHEQEQAIALAPTMPHCKRTRGNLYMAPKQIPKNTFTSQVGSLVVNRHVQNPADKNDARQVIGFRRQLSSSKIEAFLSTSVNDNVTDMDVDTEASRPRSMSF